MRSHGDRGSGRWPADPSVVLSLLPLLVVTADSNKVASSGLRLNTCHGLLETGGINLLELGVN